MATTSVANSISGAETTIHYQNWAAKLSALNYGVLVFYILGVAASAYHLSYGIWNFCIRWGITISEAAQLRVAKFARVFCVVVTLIGWAALAGFFYSPFAPKPHAEEFVSTEGARPVSTVSR
jgi:succinate dehydrogenase / fumarate reductase cytochrome b subunit